MTNLEASALLVELYSLYSQRYPPNGKKYSEAVAMAIAALNGGEHDA